MRVSGTNWPPNGPNRPFGDTDDAIILGALTGHLLEDGDAALDGRMRAEQVHEAAAGASAAMVQLLLSRGTNPGIRSKPGVTALDLAREYKNATAIEILEKVGK